MEKMLSKPQRVLIVLDTVREKPVQNFQNLCICCAESSTASLTVDSKTDKFGRQYKVHTSDVDLLFHEEKLRKLNTFTMDGIVQNLKRSVTDLSDMSDDAILQTVKSRYIQSISDVHEYTRQIMHDIDDVVEKAKFEQKRQETLRKIEENEKLKINQKETA